VELTRRDALGALAAAGATVGGAVLAGRFDPPRADSGDAAPGSVADADPSLSTELLDLLDAVAEVLYPAAVTGRREFIEEYALGRTEGRPAYRDGVRGAAAQLDAVARDWHGDSYAALDAETRDRLLRRLGVETAEPDPDGPITDRIRFYLVDDLLFALYASPAGGRLVGIENPIGHPGGIESYQRGPVDIDGPDSDGGNPNG